MKNGFAHLSLLVLALLVVIGFSYYKFIYLQKDPNGKIQVERKNHENFSSNSQTKFTVFPIKIEDLQTPPKLYGFWPYGVKGNNNTSHNEGHPGWDFELKKGSKLYAIADLKINQIHDGDHQDSNAPVLKVIEANTQLKNQNIHVVYHSVINIEKNVVEGAEIKAGSVLAEVGFPLSDVSAMMHFGIFGPRDSVGSCPTDFFDESLKVYIDKVVENSVDIATGLPYESACVGKVNKELYYQNFPERIQYLQGGEVWE